MNGPEFIRRIETDTVILPPVKEIKKWIENLDTLIYSVKRNQDYSQAEKIQKVAKLRLVRACYETLIDCL